MQLGVLAVLRSLRLGGLGVLERRLQDLLGDGFTGPTTGMLGFYPGFTQDLPRIYPGFTQDLPRIYPGFTQDLPRIYPGFTSKK